MKPTAADNDRREAVLAQLKKRSQFRLFGDDELRTLIDFCEFRVLAAGETLLNEGEYDARVFILVDGALEIAKGGRTVCHLRRTGDMVGEMTVVDGAPRSATIRAIEASRLLAFDAAIIENQGRQNHVTFCYVVYRLFAEVLAARLRDTTRETMAYRRALARFGNPLVRHG